MKKVLISVVCLMGLVGCSSKYDYFRGDIQYVQDGADCVYYMTEYAENFDGEIRGLDTNKRIVYRNTMCADLYARDHADNPPRRDRNSLIRPGEKCATCDTETKKAAEPVLPAVQPVVPTAPVPVAAPAPVVAPVIVPARPCDVCGNQMMLRRRYLIMPVAR